MLSTIFAFQNLLKTKLNIMKHLKIASYLFLMVAFFTSCEEETLGLTETSETGATKTSEMTPPPPPSNGDLQFYYYAEDFDCNNLPTQDFSEANNVDSDYISSPLNSESDNNVFSPGDILPGISFESYFGFDVDFYQGWPAVLMSNYYYPGDGKSDGHMYNSDIVVNFTTNTVYDVSMTLYGHYVPYAYIDVYGVDDNYLGYTTVNIDYNNGGYVAVRSLEEPIGSVIIRNDFMPKGDSSDFMPSMVGLGSISFGECNDYDGDGCFNEDDAYPHSNLSRAISIGENSYRDIDNVLVDCGTTMQDQIDNLINQINDSYHPYSSKSSEESEDNYDELHKSFTTKLAHITYYWRINKLITAGERAEISSDAWSAEIPYREE